MQGERIEGEGEGEVLDSFFCPTTRSQVVKLFCLIMLDCMCTPDRPLPSSSLQATGGGGGDRCASSSAVEESRRNEIGKEEK